MWPSETHGDRLWYPKVGRFLVTPWRPQHWGIVPHFASLLCFSFTLISVLACRCEPSSGLSHHLKCLGSQSHQAREFVTFTLAIILLTDTTRNQPNGVWELLETQVIKVTPSLDRQDMTALSLKTYSEVLFLFLPQLTGIHVDLNMFGKMGEDYFKAQYKG